MKRICIAGGTGFLGEILEKYFESKGHQVFILTRNPKREHEVYWDGKSFGEWVADLEATDILINLSGRSVDCRYNAKNKAHILQSRVCSTRILNKAVAGLATPPQVFLNASSATIYVHAETQLMCEAEGMIGDDFSMQVCKAWEREFFSEQTAGVRKVALRTSIVMGKSGGAFPKLKMISKMGLGGIQGDGTQRVSWIHETDFCRAIEFIICNCELEGSVNVTAPNPCSNMQLMKEIRAMLRIPFGLNQSKALLEIGAILLRTETELLLKSRNVVPERLMRAGFEFEFSTIESCITDLKR